MGLVGRDLVVCVDLVIPRSEKVWLIILPVDLVISSVVWHRTSKEIFIIEVRKGRVESERRRAESQWIVAARPLCHLQYPVAYLSRLQRTQPAIRAELHFLANSHGSSAGLCAPTTWAHGGRCPLLWVGVRTTGKSTDR